MQHDTKIGVIIKNDLETWQKLNITAFLSSGVAAANPKSIGRDYVDGSDNEYLPIFNQPVFVYEASAEHLQRTRARLNSREVKAALYAEDMFFTNNDKDNRATIVSIKSEDMNIVGLAFRAPSKIFDKIVSGLKLHS